MTEKIRIPSRFKDIGVRLFGRLTVAELARLGFPPVLAVIITYPRINLINVTVIIAALTAGVTWAVWTPRHRFVDKHIRNAANDWRNEIDLKELEAVEEYLETGNNFLIAVIQVEPVNLEMKTGDEKAAAHRTLTSLYRRINYPVEIHSLQEPLSFQDYIDHLENRDIQKDVYEQYIEYCREFDNSGVSSTSHYITVQGSNRDELEVKCREIIDAVDTGDISAHKVEETEKLSDLIKHYKKFNSRRTLAVHELPSKTDLAWTKELLQVSGQVDLTQVVHPEDPAKATSKLQRLVEKLNAEINSLRLGGHYGTNRLEGLLEDVQWMLDQLANREDQPVQYAVYITAHSQDDDAYSDTFERVEDRLNTLQVEYRSDYFLRHTASTAESPFHTDSWNHSQLMPASSAAAGFPFATRNLENSRGIVYGEDSVMSTPILLNRFSWSSHSMARMGTVGSGKSYATKLEIIRSYIAFEDLQIIVVDPKKEYGHLIRRLDGTVEILDDGSEHLENVFEDDVISFELGERGKEGNTKRLIDAVRNIRSATSQDQRKTLVVIDEARNLLNEEEGRKVLNNFVLEARDRNTAITLVTQNASHFTHRRQGREILDNMPVKVFMRHERVPDDVVDYFRLSREEKQQILGLRTGDNSRYSESVVKVSNRINTKLKVESTGSEHAIINQGEKG